MRIARQQQGAAFVFGLLFAVFLIACIYALAGVADAVLLRERMQDAADTAAFSAAVVNARGMNLIALINMIMAAVLSILVGLRLAEALGYVAIGVCVGLGYISYGSTLAAIEPIANVTSEIHDIAENLKDPLNNVLAALHKAGKVTSVLVPVGSNLRVLDQTMAHFPHTIALAVPTRLTLPVQDDEFTVLCEHAGRLAVGTALLPISPLLPSIVEDEMGDAGGKIIAAGSNWFCGKGGAPPDFNGDQKDRTQELPLTTSQAQCEEYTARASQGESVDRDQYEAACNRTAVEHRASMPDRVGGSRAGASLCPTACKVSSDKRCPPRSVPDCDLDEAQRIERLALELFGTPVVPQGAYEERARLARQQCRPESDGGANKDLTGFWWQERTIVRTYLRDAAGWHEDTSALVVEDIRLVEHDLDDRTVPCGSKGAVGPDYSLDPAAPLCRSLATCVSVQSPTEGVNCLRLSSFAFAQSFQERSVEVMAVLRCAHSVPVVKVKTKEQNVDKELNGNKQKKDKNGEGEEDDDSQNTNPFKLEDGVYFGGSDFQLRSVVVATGMSDVARAAVELSLWGQDASDASTTLSSVVSALGHVALGQGEYFFDWRHIDNSLDDERDPGDRREWLWNMGFRARLRPFRLRHGSADAQRDDQDKQGTGGQALDSEQQGYAQEGASSLHVGKLSDSSDQDSQSKAQRVLDLLDAQEAEE